MRQIYVHGLGQTPGSWESTLAQLPAAENRVCPNLADMIRGSESAYQDLYAAFSDLCNQYAEPVDLCGLSLGGVLALNYAIDHPKKVNSLALIAAQCRMPKKLLRLQSILFHFMPKSMFQQTGLGKTEFLHLCRAMMDLDFSQSLGKISCPVLIICGERDLANKSASVRMADRIEHAGLCIIGGAGHEVNVEAPEKLAAVLQGFYSKKDNLG